MRRLAPFLPVLFALSAHLVAEAQINISTAFTPQQVVEDYFLNSSSGIVVSNISFTGADSALGVFSIPPGGPNLGFSEGIILSTGDAEEMYDATFPNSTNFASTDHFLPGNPLLDNLLSGFFTTQDAAVLRFDFVPLGDTVRFRYVFTSEEYYEFVNSSFNDIFAFFVEGPGFPVPVNIAVVDTGGPAPIPVTINSINYTPNGALPFYINNDPFYPNIGPLGGPPFVDPFTGETYASMPDANIGFTFDGLTVVLTAEMVVQPCSTYTLTLAIADVGDGSYDSAVLLEGNSFGSGITALPSSPVANANGTPVGYEGCALASPSVLVFRDLTLSNPPDFVRIDWAGQATLGSDYTVPAAFQDTVHFAPGQALVTIPVTVLTDGLAEPPESLVVNIILDQGCAAQDTLSLLILIEDLAPLDPQLPGPLLVCAGSTVNVTANATGGAQPYVFDWGPLGQGATQQVGVNQDTVLYVTVTDACGSLPVQDSVVVQVTQPGALPLSLVPLNDTTLCSGTAASLTAQAVNGTGMYQYTWSTGFVGNPLVVSPGASQGYTVTASDGCDTLQDSVFVTVLPALGLSLSPDTLICQGGTAILSAQPSGGLAGNWTVTWTAGGVPVGAGLSIAQSPGTSTTFQAQLTDGCSTPAATASVQVAVRPPLSVTFNIPALTCAGANATLQANPAGGSGNYNLTWTIAATGALLGTGPSLTLASTQTLNVRLVLEDDCETPLLDTLVTFAVAPLPTFSLNLSTDSLCAGTSLQATAVGSPGLGPATWTWDFATGQPQSGSGAGPWQVRFAQPGAQNLQAIATYANAPNGCNADTATATVMVLPQPNVQLVLPAGQCLQGNRFDLAVANPDPALQYAWQLTGATPATANGPVVPGATFAAPGSWTVTVLAQDASGTCTDEATGQIQVFEHPAPPSALADTTCSGFRAQLEVRFPQPSLQYVWQLGGVQQFTGPVFTTPALSGDVVYSLFAVSAQGCSSLVAAPVPVKVNGVARLDLSVSPRSVELPTAVVQFGSSVVPGARYWEWQFGDGRTSRLPEPAYQYLEPGSFTISLTVVDSNGCVASSVLNNAVEVAERVVLQLPTAFSPNADGLNEFWSPNTRLLTQLNLKLFDRTGSLVFESSELDFAWDGTHSGQPVPEGVYVWVATATAYDGSERNATGTVTVLR